MFTSCLTSFTSSFPSSFTSSFPPSFTSSFPSSSLSSLYPNSFLLSPPSTFPSLKIVAAKRDYRFSDDGKQDRGDSKKKKQQIETAEKNMMEAEKALKRRVTRDLYVKEKNAYYKNITDWTNHDPIEAEKEIWRRVYEKLLGAIQEEKEKMAKEG